MNKILILLTLLSLSVNADPVKDVWDWANDNPIATAAIVVGAGVTVGPIAAAYFALPVAFAAEMLAPTAVEEVAGAAVGETLSTVTPETMAEFSSAFEQIMGDTAVDDLSGYTVETFGRSARAASLGNMSLDATEVTRLLPPR
jgi:hypothetical protein